MANKKTAEACRREFWENLQKKYDCSWIEALRRRVAEKEYWNKPALFYRGVTFTYKDLFEKGEEYAHSMKALGLGKGSVIPLCTGHCPEEIFTIVGASMIGAVVTPIGEHFDKDYFVERINCKNSNVLFVTDDKYGEIRDYLPETKIERVVMYSIMDSYPRNNPYRELEKPFFDGVNRVLEFKKDSDRILDKEGFLNSGEKYFQEKGFTEEKGSLDDLFGITYSSGTTNSHRPKPIKHNVSTYTGMGYIRSLETPDLNKFSKIGEIKALVHIPLYSNTSLLASICDELFLGATLCLEHIYDEKFYPISLLINKPNLAIATPSHWISAIKEFTTNPKYRNVKMRQLMAAFTAGEPTSEGEEKFINRGFKKLQAAYDFPPFKFINALGMGGGDCERCGLWRMPHRATMSKLKKVRYANKRHVDKGYETYSVVDWAILTPDGHRCGPNERGLLVIVSPFTMVGYDGMDEETAKTKIIDATGKVWDSCNLWAYYDEMGEVYLKGRYNEDEVLPLYVIEDEIAKDTKNIMSCTVVRLEDGTYVAHVASQPNCKIDLYAIEARLSKSIPKEILERLIYKIRPFMYSYPLTGSGKRDRGGLVNEGYSETLKPLGTDYSTRDVVPGRAYIESLGKDKNFTMKQK